MEMKRTVLWVVFSMSLLFLWDAWQRHQGHPSMFAPTPTAAKSTTATATPAKADSSLPTAATGPVGAPSVPSTSAASGEKLRFSNDVLALDIDTQGATIVRAELLTQKETGNAKKNIVLLDTGPNHFYQAQSGLRGVDGAPNYSNLYKFTGKAQSLDAAEKTLEIPFEAEGGGLRHRIVYILTRGSHAIAVRFETRNVSEKTLNPSIYMQIQRDNSKPAGESKLYSTYTGPVVYTEQKKFQKVDFGDIEKEKRDYPKETAVNEPAWIGMIQHYFVTAWLPENKQGSWLYTSKLSDKPNHYQIGLQQNLGSIAPNSVVTTNAKLYVGPQDQNVLTQLAPGLDLVVDYGWLTVIAKPIFILLQWLHKLVNNWGWAIVLLTVLIKVAFYPLAAAGYKSMARMKKVTPRLMALREKYKDDKMKQQQAMMELYKTEKINPLGGCLPMLVQIPVFIALYWVLLASVEMRNAPWIGWIHDLASPDPWYILPVIMMASMFIQYKLNPTPPDPMQAKLMLWMPLIFGVMFFFFPAGLVLYWVVNNVLSIAQQWYINKQLDKAGLR